MKHFFSLLLALLPLASQAQSFCSSDGRAAAASLIERFINADCEACWSDGKTPRAARGAVALDWIIPGDKGDDAPLSAVASRDALTRLESLRRAVPARSDALTSPSLAGPRKLRVAHGLPFSGYIGASIELKPPTSGPWTAWLVLVETIPPGTEGTPVERNLVRNALQVEWKRPAPGAPAKPSFFEDRPLSIPEGARHDRLRVAGWVEDAAGRVGPIAVTRCLPKKN